MVVSSYDEKSLKTIKNNMKSTRQAKVIQDDEKHAVFTYANITFLAGKDEEAQSMAGGPYDYHIIDFGQADYIEENRLHGCDRFFLIGDLSLCSYESSLDGAYLFRRRSVKDMQFMSVFYSKEGLRAYKKAVGGQPRIIPVDMEPFAISRDMIIFMETLFINS